MKKKCLFIILLVVCIGFLIPTMVYATNGISKQFVDYKFFVKDENGKIVEGLHFTLHDKDNNFNYTSQYNSEEEYYYFQFESDEDISLVFPNELININYEYNYSYSNNTNSDFIRNDFNNKVRATNKFIVGETSFARWNKAFLTSYASIPMILEESSINYKKIIFGSLHLSILGSYSSSYFEYQFSLSNNNINNNIVCEKIEDLWCDYWNDERCNYLINISESSKSFMRNAMYDYSDELWEELNSGPIASSEMQYDNSDSDLSSPKLITFKTNNDKAIYSKYKSNINYRFKVKNGNGMNFKLHDISNTFNFSSLYDKDSDTYSIIDNSSDSDYQDGIKEFSKIVIDEVKNGNFSGLATKYKSITSDSCSNDSCNIYTYIPMILEGENEDNYAKQIVLGLMNIQYKEENGNNYYDVSLNVYNNTCDLLNSNIDANQSELINLSRSISEDYSSNLMNQYSDGSISMEDIYEEVDVNTLKDKYCNELPVISLRQNPKTLNNGIVVLIISMMIVIGSSFVIIRKKNNTFN